MSLRDYLFHEEPGITLYCGDCRVLRPMLESEPIDAVVSDPPYGMAFNTDSTRFTGGEHQRGEGRSDWGAILGDGEPFDPEPWLEFPRVVLWGMNHYGQRLPVGSTLVWLKKPDHLFGTFLSDCELAWMKGGYGVYAFRKNFPPPSRIHEGAGKVLHPAQKPVGLMLWCLDKARTPQRGLVLDPFMGSGTTIEAAKKTGRRAIGIEIEPKYCEIAVKRLRQEVLL